MRLTPSEVLNNEHTIMPFHFLSANTSANSWSLPCRLCPKRSLTNGPALLEMGISPFLVFVAGRQDMVEVEEAFDTKVQDLFKEEGLVYPDFRRLFGGADRISLSAFAPPAKSFFLPPPAKPRSPFRTSPLS
jgi:hypothetical protein